MFPYIFLATTTIAGGAIVNQTWTPSGSPYVVQGDITIPNGSTLTIQAGTSVVFPGGDAQGAGKDTKRTEITVDGKLDVTGTSAQPVSFLAQNGTNPGTWYGFVVHSGAVMTIAHADVEHAVNGIFANVYPPADLTLTSSRFAHHLNDGGTFLTGTIVDCVFEDNGGNGLSVIAPVTIDRVVARNDALSGLWITAEVSQVATATNLLLTGNKDTGLVLDPFSNGTVSVANATVDGNALGIDTVNTTQPLGVFDVTNTIVSNNTQYGVRNYPKANLTLTYSDVWGSPTNYSQAQPSAGCLSTNPMYVNAAGGDYHLQAGSMCIDTGTSTGAPSVDLDGASRPVDGDGINGPAFDMGAYEYGAVVADAGAEGGTDSGTEGGVAADGGTDGGADGSISDQDGAPAVDGSVGETPTAGGCACDLGACPRPTGAASLVTALVAASLALSRRRRE